MARNNLPLGMQFRTCENFEESTDSSLVLSPKFSQIQKPHRKSFDCDSLHESNKKIKSKKPIKSFCYFWLSPKVESPLPLNPNLPNNANNARISELKKDNAQNPKFRSIIVGASGLSLGISIVVAIMLGIGAGVLMQKIFDTFWVLFLGIFWGIAAAVLNVYKVYKAELRDFEKLANDPKYKNMNPK